MYMGYLKYFRVFIGSKIHKCHIEKNQHTFSQQVSQYDCELFGYSGYFIYTRIFMILLGVDVWM